MENKEKILKVISGMNEYFNLNQISPDVAMTAMIYMIPAIIQTQFQKPRELLVAVSQDFLNLSQAIAKDVPEVKED